MECQRCDSEIPEDSGCVRSPSGGFWCYSCFGIYIITAFRGSAAVQNFEPHYFDLSRGWTPEV